MDQEALLCSEEMIGSPWSAGANAEVLDESPGDAGLASLTDFPPRDDAALQIVASRERSQMPDSDLYLLSMQADHFQARTIAVNWMLKVRNAYAFSPTTVALATNYLDRYLSRHLPKSSLKAWAVQLLAVSCISLAAKMEETVVPCLPDLQVEGLDHLFEAKTIQRMEMVVLKTLDWRMSGVTAFEYVDDLLSRLDVSKYVRASILARITELILGTLPESEFLAFRPSTIALTACCCALDEIVPLKAETYQGVLLMALPTDQETLRRCYRTIEDLIIDPLFPGVSSSQNFGSSKAPPSPMTVVDLFQTGSLDWFGNQVNLRKRKVEEGGNQLESVRSKKNSQEKRIRDGCGLSISDLFYSG